MDRTVTRVPAETALDVAVASGDQDPRRDGLVEDAAQSFELFLRHPDLAMVHSEARLEIDDFLVVSVAPVALAQCLDALIEKLNLRQAVCQLDAYDTEKRDEAFGIGAVIGFLHGRLLGELHP
ncbi:MAG: hypothetical protein GY711_03575 [bacterium]|nr:hypothetical protein [bacterium]